MLKNTWKRLTSSHTQKQIFIQHRKDSDKTGLMVFINTENKGKDELMAC